MSMIAGGSPRSGWGTVTGAAVLAAALGLLTGCGRGEPTGTQESPPDQEAEPAEGAGKTSEWERILNAAREEGTVVISGPTGDATRRLMTEGFEQAYGITVEFDGQRGSQFQQRIATERDAGVYTWDILIHGANTMTDLLERGDLEPLEQYLILPEAADPKNWAGESWVSDRRSIFNANYFLHAGLSINTKLVDEGAIASWNGLLDPKWRGKIVMDDPRVAGPGNAVWKGLAEVKGRAYLEQLMEQKPDIRSRAEQSRALASGTYHVGIGLISGGLQALANEGLPVTTIPAPDLDDAVFMSVGHNSVAIPKNAPHPNAAIVYLNWFLSKEPHRKASEASAYPHRRWDISPYERTMVGDPIQPVLKASKPIPWCHNCTLADMEYAEKWNQVIKEIVGE